MLQLRQLMFASVGDAFLKSALMALIGSAVVLLFLAAVGFPLIGAAKRVWFFVVPFEILIAAVFCAANYPNKSALGMVLWHLVRIIAAAFMSGFNNKLLAAFKRKKVFSVLYTLGANLLAQVILYYSCAIWF